MLAVLGFGERPVRYAGTVLLRVAIVDFVTRGQENHRYGLIDVFNLHIEPLWRAMLGFTADDSVVTVKNYDVGPSQPMTLK